MLKKFFTCLALLVSMHSFAQETTTEVKGMEEKTTSSTSTTSITDTPKYASYKDLELGYVHAGGANGAYIGYITSSPFKQGKSAFGVDFGLKARWVAVSVGEKMYHSMGFGAYLGFSAQLKLSEKTALVPTTGLMCNYAIPLFKGGESNFGVGWDVGARIKYSGGYLSYICSIPFEKGGGTTHSVGIGFDF